VILGAKCIGNDIATYLTQPREQCGFPPVQLDLLHGAAKRLLNHILGGRTILVQTGQGESVEAIEKSIKEVIECLLLARNHALHQSAFVL
jgi:hypothetical protein